MFSPHRLLASLAFLLLFTCLTTAQEAEKKAEGKKGPAPAELKKLIEDATKMLTDKEYGKLLDRIVEPEFKAKMKEKGEWDKVIERFGETHADRLLKVLKILPPLEPTFNVEGSEAAYALPKDLEAPRDAIVFVKIQDVWYVRN